MKTLNPKIKTGMTVITAGGINLGEITKVNRKTFETKNYMGYSIKENISDLYIDTDFIDTHDLILDK